MLTGKSLFWKLLVLLKRMVMQGVGVVAGGSSAPGVLLSLEAPHATGLSGEQGELAMVSCC